jgi:ribosomal protein S18 acetylase RimI-like enzyme
VIGEPASALGVSSDAEARDDGAIVRLGLDDAGELLTLQHAAFAGEARRYRDFEIPPLLQTVDERRAELADENVIAFGIKKAGRLVGSVRVRHDETGKVAEVARLVVAPDQQGLGLGSTLLEAADSAFPEVPRRRLFTGDLSERALHLYRKHGYREVRRTPADGYVLVHLAKDLNGP